MAADLVWSERPNDDRDPLEYEDKWGKVNMPNYSFYAPVSGLSINSPHAGLFSRSSQFSLELWLKLPTDPGEDLILVVLQIGELTLTLMRENNACALTLSGRGAHEVKEIPVLSQKWMHFAVVQQSSDQGKLKVVVDFEVAAEFSNKFDMSTVAEKFNMLEALNARALVTEVRLWRVPLSCRQLRNTAR